MTRTTDTLIALGDRGGFCTAACDLFVSLHVNSLARRRGYTDVRGFETFFLAEAQDRGRRPGGQDGERSGALRDRRFRGPDDRRTRLHPQGSAAERASARVRPCGRAGAAEARAPCTPARPRREAGRLHGAHHRPPARHSGRAGLQHQPPGRPATHLAPEPAHDGRGDRRRGRGIPAGLRAEDGRCRGREAAGDAHSAPSGPRSRSCCSAGACTTTACTTRTGWPTPPGRPSATAAPSRPTISGARSSRGPTRWWPAIPSSKYVDEAMVLKGMALARLNQCEAALAPLGRVALLPSRSGGRGGRHAGARALPAGAGEPRRGRTDVRASGSEPRPDPAARGNAAPWEGAPSDRPRGGGREDTRSPPPTRGPRPSGCWRWPAPGQRDEALGLADSLLAQRDSTADGTRWSWPSDARTPRWPRSWWTACSAEPASSEMARARMLLDDGERLASVDTARATARLRQVAAMEGAADAGERARLHLTRLDLSRATSVADLAPIARSLDERVPAARGALVGEAAELRQSVARIQAADDSASAGARRRPTSDSSSRPKPRATRSGLPRSRPRSSVASSNRPRTRPTRRRRSSPGAGPGCRLG